MFLVCSSVSTAPEWSSSDPTAGLIVKAAKIAPNSLWPGLPREPKTTTPPTTRRNRLTA